MAITDSFIDNLPSDLLKAESEIINFFIRMLKNQSNASDLDVELESTHYVDYIELFSFYQVFAEKHNLDVSFPKLGTNRSHNVELIMSFFRNRHRIVSRKMVKYSNEKLIADKKTFFKAKLNNEFYYKFEDYELRDIQRLIFEILELIGTSKTYNSVKTNRLIARLESLSKGLESDMDNIDGFWSLTGEAGILIGKIGDDANPVVDKIRNIIQLIWTVQSRSEGLGDKAPKIVLSFNQINPEDDSECELNKMWI